MKIWRDAKGYGGGFKRGFGLSWGLRICSQICELDAEYVWGFSKERNKKKNEIARVQFN